MEEITKEYTGLFNGVSDTIEDLETIISKLQQLHQNAEERYIQRTLFQQQ